jgi:hypothetical protein
MTKAGRDIMSKTLRNTILDCGETLYQVSQRSGVSYAALHRFVVGKRPIAMRALDKLCMYLGLRLMR